MAAFGTKNVHSALVTRKNIVSHHLRPSVCIISPSVRRLRRCRRGHGCVVIIACEGQLIVDHRQTKPVEATRIHTK